MVLPELDNVLSVYEDKVDKGDVDEANLFITLIAGVASFLWEHNLISDEYLREYFSKLRESILEGPDYLNPYVMELLGILSQGLSGETLQEFRSKLRMLLKEDRLDVLEV